MGTAVLALPTESTSNMDKVKAFLAKGGLSGEHTIDRAIAGAFALSLVLLFTVQNVWFPAVTLIAILGSVVLHEWAHKAAARIVKVRTVEFFCGFGPRLVSWHRSGCDYGVKLIPMGGYIKLHPTDEATMSRGAKAFIAVAGPVMNFIIALALLFGVAMSNGDSASVAAGKTKDIVVLTTTAMVDPVLSLPANTVTMTRGVLGGEKVASDERIMSPIGLGQVADAATDESNGGGWKLALVLIAAVNLALGLFNLVPIPPLDGGHIILGGAEALLGRIRGRDVKLSERVVNAVAYGFIGLTLAATAAAMVLDLTQPMGNPFG